MNKYVIGSQGEGTAGIGQEERGRTGICFGSAWILDWCHVLRLRGPGHMQKGGVSMHLLVCLGSPHYWMHMALTLSLDRCELVTPKSCPSFHPIMGLH